MLTAKAYDNHVEQLFQRVQQLHSLLTDAGVPYRIIGGLAVFIHVSERDPIRARLTADIDAAVYREHLSAIIEATCKAGWIYQHAAGMDKLVEVGQPKARSAVHLVFLNEKVRPKYAEAIPASAPIETHEGIPARDRGRSCPHETHQLSLEGSRTYSGSRRSGINRRRSRGATD